MSESGIRLADEWFLRSPGRRVGSFKYFDGDGGPRSGHPLGTDFILNRNLNGDVMNPSHVKRQQKLQIL